MKRGTGSRHHQTNVLLPMFLCGSQLKVIGENQKDLHFKLGDTFHSKHIFTRLYLCVCLSLNVHTHTRRSPLRSFFYMTTFCRNLKQGWKAPQVVPAPHPPHTAAGVRCPYALLCTPARKPLLNMLGPSAGLRSAPCFPAHSRPTLSAGRKAGRTSGSR